MSIDFLDSPRGCDLYACARVIKSWGKVSIADIEITDEANTVYAVSRGSWSTSRPFYKASCCGHLHAAAQLPSHNHCLRSVNAVDLEYVLGDIQTDCANLHVDGSPQ
jgi:hypothetical protein